MNKKFNRQSEDYILTDLLPVEKGNFYTNVYLYEYIFNNNIFKDKTISPQNVINSNSHSFPLKFKTKKKENFRELSIINPYGLLEALYFIEAYGNELVNIINYRNKFGQRVPRQNKQALYKYNDGQTVYYDTIEDKEQLLINLESSGSFYNHYPFKRLNRLLNSPKISYFKDKFDYILHYDIENFFGSIYTHSYTWLISNRSMDATKFNDTNSLYAIIDKLLQNLNGSKTNGIIVGPELSRMLAEFLLVFLDKNIETILYKHNIIRGDDYEIVRFVDDYYLYTNDKKIQKEVYSIYVEVFNEFHLKFKESKTQSLKSNEDIKYWFEPTREFIKYIKERIIKKEDADYKTRGRIDYNNLKSKIEEIIYRFGEVPTVSSYILTTILTTLEEHEELKNKLKIGYLDFTYFIFYLVSLYPSYIAIQKLISILNLILTDETMDKEYIERAINRFSSKIFTGYLNDWLNLIIYCGVNNIRLTKTVEEEYIFNYITEETNDPRILAGITIYIKSTSKRVNRNKYFTYINDLIKTNLNKIKLTDNNYKKIFQNSSFWWVIIFISCPYEELSEATNLQNVELKSILKKFNDKNNETTKITEKIKIYLIEFLIDSFNNQQNNGFIRWDFNEKINFDKFYFFTRKRTIFDPNIDDFLTLSY